MDKYATTQGQAWDQVGLAAGGSEKHMGDIIPANEAEADAVFFAGSVTLAIPKLAPEAVKSLPPWERM